MSPRQIKDTIDDFVYHNKVAQKRGLELTVYEGGQHITGNGYAAQENQLLTDFFIELNRRPEMYDIYTELLEGWKNYGGNLFMHFSDIVNPTKWGSWGALEYVGQDSSPKYDALIDFISKNPVPEPAVPKPAPEPAVQSPNLPEPEFKWPKEISDREQREERVPEPSTVWGLVALGAICSLSVLKRKTKI